MIKRRKLISFILIIVMLVQCVIQPDMGRKVSADMVWDNHISGVEKDITTTEDIKNSEINISEKENKNTENEASIYKTKGTSSKKQFNTWETEEASIKNEANISETENTSTDIISNRETESLVEDKSLEEDSDTKPEYTLESSEDSLLPNNEESIDIQAPSVPANLTAEIVSGPAVILSWEASTDDVEIAGYKVYRDGIEIGSTINTSYTDKDINEGNTYTYTVRAYDLANNLSAETQSVFITIESKENAVPSAPRNLSIVSIEATEVTISWDAPENDAGLEGYKIFRDEIEIGSTTELYYIDTDLVSGNTYSYTVRAFDTNGELSDSSNIISLSTKDMIPPSAPANLKASTVSGPAIRLSWDKSIDNVAVAGYIVYRNDYEIGSVTDTVYLDSTIASGSTYTYYVKAYDEDGNISEASNSYTITMPPDIPANLTVTVREDGILLRWTGVNDICEYELSINEEIIKVGKENLFLQKEFLPNFRYEYRVRAVIGDIYGQWSESKEILTAPGKVENLKSEIIDDSAIKLSWDPVEGALSYDVEIDGILYQDIKDCYYFHEPLDEEKTYDYRVRAVNGTLIGIWSDMIQKSIVEIIPGGIILEDVVWKGKYKIEGDVTIASGATLEIMPGTIMRFNEGTGISVEGQLIAKGTDQGEIVFTAYKDGEYGGSGVTGVADSWKGIAIQETGSFIGEYTRIKAAGYRNDTDYFYISALYVEGKLSYINSEVIYSYQSGIYIDSGYDVVIQDSKIDGSFLDNIIICKDDVTDGSVTIENNIVSNALGCGLYIEQQGLSGIIVENNNIINNTESGILISGHGNGLFSVLKNNISDNGSYPIKIVLNEIKSSAVFNGIQSNTFTGNNISDYIMITGDVNEDLTLSEGIYIFENIIVSEDKIFTILPGTVLLGYGRSGTISVYGKLIAEGTEEKPIIFSSKEDTQYGGKGVYHNRDGWRNILVGIEGELRGNYLQMNYSGYYDYILTSMSYSEYYYDGAIISYGQLYLVNSLIQKSFQSGVVVYGYNNITIQNTIIDGASEGIKIGSSFDLYDNGYMDSNNSYEDYRETKDNTINIQNNTIMNAINGICILDIKDSRLIVENNIITFNKVPIRAELSEIHSEDIILKLLNNEMKNNEQHNLLLLSGFLENDLIIPEAMYIMDDVVIPNGVTLEVRPGTVLFIEYNMGISGILRAIGTNEKPIIFTSKHDPEYMYLGITSTGYPRLHWHEISIYYNGSLEAIHTKIRYGYNNISCRGNLTLINSEITNAENTGISFWEIVNHPTVMFNKFKNNKWAVNISESIYLDLSYNYWGSIFGPGVYIEYFKNGNFVYYPKSSSPGEKIAIYERGVDDPDIIDDKDYINFLPYLGSEMNINLHFNRNDGTYAPTGNYSKQYSDLSVKYLDDSIDFIRSYNSSDSSTSVFGKGWSFNFESSLKDYNNYEKMKEVTLPDGGRDYFIENVDGSYSSCYSRNKLVKNNDGTYLLTTKEQISYKFNSKGLLIYVESKEGNRLTIEYNGNSKPKTVTDYVGRKYTFEYNENNLLTKITDPMGRAVRYYYKDNRLVKVIDPAGIVTTYSYSEDGYLSEIKDGKGNLQEAVVYTLKDGEPKVSKETDSYGNVKTYTYENGKTIITDSNGLTTTQWYDTTYSITKSTDAGGRTSLIEYYTDNGINKYNEIKSTTDRNGNIIIYERDSRGNITKVINPDLSYKEYTYDSKNNIISERDEEGKYTYYIYDSSQTFLEKIVKPLNGTDIYYKYSDQSKFAITTYSYYPVGQDGYTVKGLLKSITDSEGNTTTYTYDSYGNIKTITDSLSNTTTYEYNIIGLCTSVITPKNEKSTYYYDNNGNLIKSVLHNGETEVTVYDELGRKVQVITPNLYEKSESDDVGYRYTYYPNGLLHAVTDPEDNTTTYTYDLYGNIKTETKANECTYIYEYDELQRIIAEYVKETSKASPVLLKTYEYSILKDQKTQEKEVIYLNENETAETTRVYDYAERLVRQVNPDGGILNTNYNLNGTIYSTEDALGKVTYYKYDGLNRLTEQWTPFSDGYMYTYQSYSYDNNDNMTIEKVGLEPVYLWQHASSYICKYYEYDENNRKKVISDSSGSKTVYEYDANGNIIKEIKYFNETDASITTYDYNHLGKVTTMTQYVNAGDIYGYDWNDETELALVTTYTYDANGNILSMTTPDGRVTTYTYDNLDRQTSVTVEGNDEYGTQSNITTSTTYDFAGNVLTTTDSYGNVTKNKYNQRGLLELTIDPLGGKTAYYYDNAGRLRAKVMPENYIDGAALSQMSRAVYTYDKMNRIILEQDIYYDEDKDSFKTINAKAYKYDLNGNVIKTLDALGYESGTGKTIEERIATGYGTINTYNDANLLISTLTPVSKDGGLSYDVLYTYDAAGRKTSETDANQVVTRYYYDDAGRIIKTTIDDGTEKVLQQTSYDGLGNILNETDGNGNTTTFTYNRLGQIRSKTLPGDETIDVYTIMHQYDSLGRLAYQIDSTDKVLIFTYNHDGQVLSKTEQKVDGTESIIIKNAYDKNGNLRFESDANGTITEYKYDALNRLTCRKINVSGKDQKTTYTYDKNNNLLTTTDWLGNTYTNKYDAINRLISKTDPYGKLMESYVYNDNHAQISSCDALGNVTLFTYDKNNRLISTTDPEGNVTYQTYDKVGNIASKKDGEGNTTSYEYDALNRLIKVENAKGENTSYTYDMNGNMLTQTDGKGNTITFTYNAANQIAKKVYPGSSEETDRTVSYTYYADGKVMTMIDRNGNTTEYAYDIHGNLLSKTVGSTVITYTYDANGNMLTMTDITGTTSRTYDELGRVLTKDVPNVGTITFAYDIVEDVEPGFIIERSIDPKGNITDKVYDKAGRLSKVIVGNEETTYTYYDNGNRESITYNDGTREEYTYFANNQINTLVNKKADGSTMDYYSYTYDKAGNQLTKYEVINGVKKGTTTYTYDELNRISSVTEPNGRVTTYTYDKVGNRETETIVITAADTNDIITTKNTYTYNSQNWLTEITTTVNNIVTEVTIYTYDNNGNQLTTNKKTYEDGVETSSTITATNYYDLFNQLTKTITADGTIVENFYNAEGYRTIKAVNGEKIYYLYEADKVILEVDEAGKQKARNVYGTNLLMRTVDGETYYYLYNGHGDVTALITSEGEIAASYYYDAFGNILESTGDVDNSILYCGYQYDKETGLYYLNARMYDPKIARFLQEDTYTGDPNDPLSLNLYTYCNNNPITYYDPTGHAVIGVVIGMVIGGLIGGVFDAGYQMIFEKKSFKELDYKSIAVSALEGAISGGIGAAVAGTSLAAKAGKGAVALTGKQLAKQGVVTAVTEGVIGASTNAVAQYAVHGKVNTDEVILSGVTDAVAGGIGAILPHTKVGKALSKAKEKAKSTISNNISKITEKIKKPFAQLEFAGIGKLDLSADDTPNVSVKKNAIQENFNKVNAQKNAINNIGNNVKEPKAKGGSNTSLKINEIPLAKPGEDLYVGTYSKSSYWNKKTGLNKTHTPHHVVQDAVSSVSHGKGITINIRKDIHLNTETYGSLRTGLTNRQHLAADVAELRGLLKANGYSRSTINAQLNELIKQNKALGGFEK